MKNLFVSFEESLKLKELGFDEPCFFYYNEAGEAMCHAPILETNSSYKHNEISQVLYSQAFEWFRNKHNLHSWIKPIFYDDLSLGYSLVINDLIVGAYTKYDKAQLACLQELIKIVSE